MRRNGRAACAALGSAEFAGGPHGALKEPIRGLQPVIWALQIQLMVNSLALGLKVAAYKAA